MLHEMPHAAAECRPGLPVRLCLKIGGWTSEACLGHAIEEKVDPSRFGDCTLAIGSRVRDVHSLIQP
jgi:hypothetical protein